MQFILGVEGRSLLWFVRYACMHILTHPGTTSSSSRGQSTFSNLVLSNAFRYQGFSHAYMYFYVT